MKKKQIIKIHQSFNLVQNIDGFYEENFNKYCKYINLFLSEISYFENCNNMEKKKDYFYNYIKDISSKFPFLIFSILKYSSDDDIIKYYFWNGNYFLDNNIDVNILDNKINKENIFISIFFDYSSVDFFSDDIYKYSLIISGSIYSEIKSYCLNKCSYIELIRTNDNYITRALNFNVCELAHILTLRIKNVF